MEICLANSRTELGEMAARAIGTSLRARLAAKDSVRMIFAAAPSQSETLSALLHEPDIDWRRVTAFHMDEYIDLPAEAPQRFATWLRRAFFDHLPLAKVYLIQPGDDPAAISRAYASALAEAPIDLVLLGIGTNGHLAFNDPPADLHDPQPVKIVELDAMCREQQVLDGCFAALDEVPRKAITLTVPTLLAGRELFCSVPGRHKAAAVKAMLKSPISGDCPATVLRTHPHCVVYLDPESGSLTNLHQHDKNQRA
jgi:glucosamine-6-phosphate deaminase